MGHVLVFEVRVCPIIREGRTGKERDASLAAADKSADAMLNRGQVYGQWLRDNLARQGGAELIDVSLERFCLLEVLRKSRKVGAGEPRSNRAVNGPDAVLKGRLRVTDSFAFAELVARGVGRHRAFGFGLLLLRPARH
jgi:CRISPR system Cascade subunit CasE